MVCKFVDIEKFIKLPEDIQKLLKESGVLPVTGVALRNWTAITEPCPRNCGGNKDCDWCNGSGRKNRYIINEGSSRSSKTYSMIDCYDRYARETTNKRLTVWRDTKVDCKKTVLNDTLKHFKITGRYKKNQEFNKTESFFTYSGGSTFEIHGTDDEEAVHGLTQDAAWFNEPYKISRETFDQVDQRTTDFVFIDWNPKKAHFIDDIKKDKRALVIHSTFQDNPLCPPEQRTKILSYQPVKYAQIVTDGYLSETDAMIYDFTTNKLLFTDAQLRELSRCIENEQKKSANEFNWCVYGLGIKAERPNRIFRWEEIPDHVYKSLDAKRYLGVDWGAVDPWAIIEAKYYDGAIYFHELNYASENEIRATMSPEQLQAINSRDEGMVGYIFEKLNIEKTLTIICDNNRESKIRALRQSGWHARAALKPKGSIIDGIDLLNNLRVYYTASSKNLKYEQENYSRQIDRYGVVLEEPEDVNNHGIDACRYISQYLQYIKIIKKV